LGPNVDEFERLLGEYIGAPGRVVALSAGTAALHLGLVMLGVKAGDEVMCQSFTFSASANPYYLSGRTSGDSSAASQTHGIWIPRHLTAALPTA